MAVSTVAPPTVLSMDDYERDWKPQGWQLIIIGPTSTWRQEWGEWEAVRDIVQNALDVAEAYNWGYDDRGLWISDRGRGVQVADFLLGPPKLKPDWARGRFGEGMKIASLALIRKGHPVYIETVGRELWIIFLKQKVNGMADTLAAMWRGGGRTVGTKFHIIGYTGGSFGDRFAVNLPRSAVVWETPSTLATPVRRYNQLIQHEFREVVPGASLAKPSRIYARDIYLRDLSSPFTYNLWSFEMAPDRHGPKSEADMWVDVGRLWCGVGRVDLLENFLKMVCDPPLLRTDESREVRLDEWAMGQEPVSGKRYTDLVKDNAQKWQSAWTRVFGEGAVISTADRWDGTVKHLGYASVRLQWYVRDTLAEVIAADSELIKASQERLREVEAIPDERLSPRELAHLKLARAIAERERHPPVAGVHAAIIPPASDRVRTAGLYSRITQEIFIALDQLGRARSTVDTLIHELAHHVSGAEDLEEGHSQCMTRVAARVVELTAAREFDELLKEAAW